MKTLVTGVAGFVGSNIARALLRRGDEVIGVDCFIDYYPRVLKENNLKPLLADKRFTFHEKNLLDLDLVKLLDGVGQIYHQAAQAGVRASWGKDFEIYTQNNILATQRLLEAAKGRDGLRFIYASSSSVYGETNKLPEHEDDAPQPISPYGVSKLAAEHLCRLYASQFGVHTVSLRYFTVYGPGQRPDMAFHKFLRAIYTGGEIPVFGDGKQTRDYTFIDDIVEANLRSAEAGGKGAVYNIGGGSRVDLNYIFDIMRKVTGRKLNIVHIDKQKGDVSHTSADTTRARKEIGYNPRVTLEEGLAKEAEWIEKVALPLTT